MDRLGFIVRDHREKRKERPEYPKILWRNEHGALLDLDPILVETSHKEPKESMGQFRIEITAVGGHGCDRTARENEATYRVCNRIGCPDCELRAFLTSWKLRNVASLESATLTHWPGTESEVVDDVLNQKRLKGHF